jgi:hypothetical protein
MTAALALPPAFPARIRICSDRSFEPDETGTLAVLLPVELDPEIEIDTVAWTPDRPRRWFFERHVASHLGDRALHRAQWFGQPINLVSTPALWLTAPDQSMCILDWQANLRGIFGDVADIVCSSPELARFLDRRLCEQVAHRYRISVAK